MVDSQHKMDLTVFYGLLGTHIALFVYLKKSSWSFASILVYSDFCEVFLVCVLVFFTDYICFFLICQLSFYNNRQRKWIDGEV